MSYRKRIADFTQDGGWTALNTSSSGVTTVATAWSSTACLQFDKANGSGYIGGAYCTRTIAPGTRKFDISHLISPDDYITWVVNLAATTNVTFATVRIGTSASHYLEWNYAVGSITAARWCRCAVRLGDATIVGNGCNWRDIRYVAIGITFDAEARTLADIEVDALSICSADQV